MKVSASIDNRTNIVTSKKQTEDIAASSRNRNYKSNFPMLSKEMKLTISPITVVEYLPKNAQFASKLSIRSIDSYSCIPRNTLTETYDPVTDKGSKKESKEKSHQASDKTQGTKT